MKKEELYREAIAGERKNTKNHIVNLEIIPPVHH